eukprot:403364818
MNQTIENSNVNYQNSKLPSLNKTYAYDSDTAATATRKQDNSQISSPNLRHGQTLIKSLTKRGKQSEFNIYQSAQNIQDPYDLTPNSNYSSTLKMNTNNQTIGVINDLRIQKNLSENRIQNQKSNQKIAFLNSQMIQKKIAYNLESITQMIPTSNLQKQKQLKQIDSNTHQAGSRIKNQMDTADRVFKMDPSIKQLDNHKQSMVSIQSINNNNNSVIENNSLDKILSMTSSIMTGKQAGAQQELKNFKSKIKASEQDFRKMQDKYITNTFQIDQQIQNHQESQSIQQLQESYTQKSLMIINVIKDILNNSIIRTYFPILNNFALSLLSSQEQLIVKIASFSQNELKSLHDQINASDQQIKVLEKQLDIYKQQDNILNYYRQNAFQRNRKKQEDLDQFDKMTDLTKEETEIKRLIENDYALIRAHKNGLSADEIDQMSQEEIQPRFSGVNNDLFDIYKFMVKHDDQEHIHRQFTMNLSNREYQQIETDLKERLSGVQMETARLVLRRFFKKSICVDNSTQTTFEDEKKIVIFDLSRKLESLKQTAESNEQKLKYFENINKELNNKNATLNRELRDQKDSADYFSRKNVILEQEFNQVSTKMKQQELKLFNLSENHKDVEKNLDIYKKKFTLEKQANQRIMHNVKRLTLKLRKAQQFIFAIQQEENKGNNSFQLSTKDFEIVEFEPEELNEKEQIVYMQELRDRVEQYISSEIENIVTGKRKADVPLKKYDPSHRRDSSLSSFKLGSIGHGVIEEITQDQNLNDTRRSNGSNQIESKRSNGSTSQDTRMHFRKASQNITVNMPQIDQEQNLQSKPERMQSKVRQAIEKEKMIKTQNIVTQQPQQSQPDPIKLKIKLRASPPPKRKLNLDLPTFKPDLSKKSVRQMPPKDKAKSPKVFSSIQNDLIKASDIDKSPKNLWQKPKHTVSIGIQVFEDKEQMMEQKYGWKKQYANKLLQTDEYLFSPEAHYTLQHHLKEYERYLGPKIHKKSNGTTGIASNQIDMSGVGAFGMGFGLKQQEYVQTPIINIVDSSAEQSYGMLPKLNNLNHF